jgi:hypothetical protein
MILATSGGMRKRKHGGAHPFAASRSHQDSVDGAGILSVCGVLVVWSRVEDLVVLGGKGTLKKDLSALRDTFIETAAQAASERLLLAERCGALPPSFGRPDGPLFFVSRVALLLRRSAPRCKESERALQERQEEVARLQVHCRYIQPSHAAQAAPKGRG